MRVWRVAWPAPTLTPALALALAAALAACHHEPTFDERYANARAELSSEAAGIDAELAARSSEAAAADAVLGTGAPSRR